jgi:DNA-binding MarR family transcriptional regulator
MAPSLRFWLTLSKLHHLLSRRLEQVLSSLELTGAQYRVLKLLAEGKASSAGEIAQQLDVSPGNLTGILDRLEQGGWIKREESYTRRRPLQLTPEGKERYQEAARRLANSLQELFATLSPNELAELEALGTRLLERLGEESRYEHREAHPFRDAPRI